MEDFGLLYFNARWLDPALGRFAQADSIVPGSDKDIPLSLIADYHEVDFLYKFNQYNARSSGGTHEEQIARSNSSLGNVQAFDRFSYVQNNPPRNIDNNGHCLWDLCVVEIGAVSIGVVEILAAAGVLTATAYTYGPGGQQRIADFSNTIVKLGEQTAESLSTLMRGEYIPSGLSPAERNRYRDAVHQYKDARGIPPNVDVPKDILDQIANSIKDGASATDAADAADDPPELPQRHPETES